MGHISSTLKLVSPQFTALKHLPFVSQHTQAWCDSMPCLKLVFMQHIKDLYSHTSSWINSCLLFPGEGVHETSVPQPGGYQTSRGPGEWSSTSSLLALHLFLYTAPHSPSFTLSLACPSLLVPHLPLTPPYHISHLYLHHSHRMETLGNIELELYCYTTVLCDQ